MLIDTHAHLYWDSYKPDLNEVIHKVLDAGVSTVINVGVDVEKSKKALSQIQNELFEIPGLTCYSTIGIHPHEAVKYSSGKEVTIALDMEQLEKIYAADSTKVVGVGECGLDYYFDPQFTPADVSIEQIKNLQRQLFQAQIDLAKKLNLPLIVHCRDDRSCDTTNTVAWDEILTMIDHHPTILHCYSGLKKTTSHLLTMDNVTVSFAANITYPKNDYLKEAIKMLPLSKIVLETDCPFLPLQSKRSERNDPSSVLEIARFIADLKGVAVAEVESHTTSNAKKILQLAF